MTQIETDPAAQALETLERYIEALKAKDSANTELIDLMQVQLDEAKALQHRAWMARNHLMRKLKLGLGPNSAWTAEEIDAEMRAKGITVVVTPPEPPPQEPDPVVLPVRPSLRLEPVNLSALPQRVQAAAAAVDAFVADPKSYPNVSRLADITHPEVDGGQRKLLAYKSNRALQTAFDMAWFTYIHIPDIKYVRLVAEYVMAIKSGTVDRSLKDPVTGDYSAEYYKLQKEVQRRHPKLTASQIDQEGLERQISHNAKVPDFNWIDGIPLERFLTDGTRVEMALMLKDHTGQGDALIDAAYSYLMDLIYQTEERSAFLAVHAKGKDPLYGFGQGFRHSLLARASALTGLWELTGEAKYSTAADLLWEWWMEDWTEVELPNNRLGRGGTHKIVSYQKYIYGTEVERAWLKSVYLEEMMPRLGKRALMGNTPLTMDDFVRTTNLLYNTLCRWGWTETEATPPGEKLGWIAGDMGGGGVNLPDPERHLVRLLNGRTFPAPYRVGRFHQDGGLDHDLFLSITRGLTFVGAAYTPYTDFEDKLREAQRVNLRKTPERGGLNFALMLYDFKHAGMLRTALT
jgi:hypothetical protein